MIRRLGTTVALLVLASLFLFGLIVSLGGDSDAEPVQWLMGILSGLCVVGAVAALIWPGRG